MPAEPNQAEALALLERFVVDNDDLLRLEELIGRFNIFDALGVARREIQHSNFLAWLLDPQGSHGQGDLFLKSLVMDILKRAPAEKRPMSAAHLDGADLQHAEVRREWRNIDLLILSREPKLQFVIAVENKVDSAEHSDQLSRYESIVRTEFPNLRPLFVFLTPEGSEASRDEWVPYQYAHLYNVLTRVGETGKGSLGPDVVAFLKHYLTLVKRQLMTDEEIDQLCRNIYHNHRAAIDLIMDRAGHKGNPVIAELERRLSASDAPWTITKSQHNEIRFVPNAWLRELPPIRRTHSTLEAAKRGWVCCYFWSKDGELELSVWVLKTTDGLLQDSIVKRLTRDPAEFGLQYPRRKTRWTEGWTPILERKIVEWDADSDPDVGSVCDLAMIELHRVLDKADSIAMAIRSVCSGR